MIVEISKHEFLIDAEIKTVYFDGLPCKIYSRRLIVAEKMRAIVQQMPEAPPSAKRTRRPRDFFDIYAVCHGKEDEILGTDFQQLLEQVFAAKQTPITLLAAIPDDRAFHEEDWQSVRDTALGAGSDFAPYFDYVVGLANTYSPTGT